MRGADDTSLKRLRQTAWSLGVALAGETPATAFKWVLLVQQHLYFCWVSTRPWWVFRRLLAGVLHLNPWREYVLIRLQLVVLRLAQENDADLQRVYQAIEAEENTRFDLTLHGNSSPAARRKLQRAAEEGLPLVDIATLLKTRRVTIDGQGEVNHHGFAWRWRVVWFVLFLTVVHLLSIWGVAFQPSFGRIDTAVFFVVAAGFVAVISRILFGAIRDEVHLVERLRDLAPLRRLGSSKEASDRG